MNPSTGTFTGMDSYAGNISDPDTLHKYLYANGNPVKYVDPSGNMATLGEANVAMGISAILDNIETSFNLGILNGLMSASLASMCGCDDNAVTAAFWKGFGFGFSLSALSFFVSGCYAISLWKVYMVGELAFGGEDLLYAGYYYVNGDKNTAMLYLMTATAHFTIAAGIWNLNFNAGLLRVGNLSEKANIDVKSAGGSGTVNPKDVRYMQSSIKNQTRDYTVLDNAQALKDGTLKPSDLPEIRIWKDNDGNLWTLDHRRLAAFRIAGVDEVPFRWATDEEVASQMWKMTTKTG